MSGLKVTLTSGGSSSSLGDRWPYWRYVEADKPLLTAFARFGDNSLFTTSEAFFCVLGILGESSGGSGSFPDVDYVFL